VEEARSSRVWRRLAIVGLGVLLGSLQGACGGSTPSAPTAPPGPVNAGFLHVLQDTSVVTYDIDAATGRLRQSATQSMGDVHTLTGEPQGRYVFAGFGPRSGAPYDPSIVAYAPDPSSGSLKALSEASSNPIWCPSCAFWGRSQEWHWLSASSTRVYGIWETVTYHDTYNTYVTHAVGDDGRLGTAHVQDLSEWDPDGVAIDADSGVFYKGTEREGLTAHLVEPDGSLEQMAASDLCLSSTLRSARPLAAVRGVVFAWSLVEPDERTVCSWEGPRLTPRANLGLESDYAVALPSRGVSGAASSSTASRAASLVAMRTSHPVSEGDPFGKKYEVRVFAMSDDGGLEPLDTVEPGYARQLLFHPSGRFLYVSHAKSSSSSTVDLTVYSIDSQGHLAAVQTLDGGGGAMAVTSPAAVASAPAR
jgi:hypothetical protein